MIQAPKNNRILAIAPSTRGFGFAVLEGEKTLVDWGVKSSDKHKNPGSLAKVEELIVHYRPTTLVLPECSNRSPRIQVLAMAIVGKAKYHHLPFASFSRDQLKRTFFEDAKGSKHSLAQMVAERFPEELGFRLPPKRRPWMSEDYRMDIFEAVALALVCISVKTGSTVGKNNGEQRRTR